MNFSNLFIFYFSVVLGTVFASNLLENENIDATELCGGALDGDSGSIEYPGEINQLQPGDVCVWTIHLETTRDFKFNFTNLNVTSTTSNCTDSGVRIYALTNLVAPGKQESYTFCDEQPSENAFYLSYNVAVVVLYVGVSNNQPGTGFTLNWEGNGYDSLRTKHASSFSNVPEGIIRYPLSGEYSTSLAATWLLKSVTSQQTNKTDIKFNSIQLESCSNPLDSCTCDAVVLYQISPLGVLNETTRFCGESNEGEFLNAESRFIIAFFTDVEKIGSDGKGFEVIYFPSQSSITTEQPSTTTVEPTTEKETTTTELPTSEDPVYPGTECGEVFHQDDGYIRYKVGEQYNENERCSFTIVVSTNQINLTLVRTGINYDTDMIQVAAISQDTNPEHNPLLNIENFPTETFHTITINGSAAIITFASAGNAGTGFELYFFAIGPQHPSFIPSQKSTHFIHNGTASGTDRVSLSYPSQGNYDNYELSTFLVSMPYFQKGTHEVWVDYYRVGLEEACYDSLFHYFFTPNGWITIDRICDDVETTGAFHADMQLYIFMTDQTKTSSGFQLNWYYYEIPQSK